MEARGRVEVYLETTLQAVFHNWDEAERVMGEAEAKYPRLAESPDWQKIRQAFNNMRQAWKENGRRLDENPDADEDPRVEETMTAWNNLFFLFFEDGFKTIMPYMAV